MIKMIASDLDGTLLYQRDNTVSEEMFEYIRELKRRGILFAAASGRQYANLRKLFAPVCDDIAYICENGAVVFYQGEKIAEKTVPMERLKKMIPIIEGEEKTEVLLSSAATSYVKPKDPEYLELLYKLGTEVTVVSDWDEVQEDCVKLALYEKAGVEGRLEYWQPKFEAPAKVVTSGRAWLDILFPDTHKGVGMDALRKHLGVKKEEVMAFGDNLNDLEMLEAVGYPVAMDNAREAVRRLCPYHTPRVETMIGKMLENGFPG